MKAGMSIKNKSSNKRVKVLEVIKGKLEIQDPTEIDRCHCMGKHKKESSQDNYF